MELCDVRWKGRLAEMTAAREAELRRLHGSISLLTLATLIFIACLR